MSIQRFAVAAVLASTTAAAASDTPVKSVDVQFDQSAIESVEAVQFWGNLETDLEVAIMERVADRLSDSGSEIKIDIDELLVSNSFAAALGADSVLAGDIAITNEDDNTKNSFYSLTINLTQAGDLVSDGETTSLLTLPEEDAYAAMVDAYAASVVERMR